MSYTKHVSPIGTTPQTEKAKDNQVKNNDGAFVFKIDEWKRLDRFLILGCEKGSYYASEKDMTLKNYDVIKNLVKIDGKRVVDTIVSISEAGRAPKNAPAIFALAVCSVFGDITTKTLANKAMPIVCRYSTDMFAWVDAVLTLKEGKKAKGLARAISRWYTGKEARELAYQVCKYPSRTMSSQSISHKDLLRICRPSKDSKNSAFAIPTNKHALLFKYITHGIAKEEDLLASKKDKSKRIGLTSKEFSKLEKDEELKYVYGHENAKKASTSKEVIELIKKYHLTRESIPNNLFNDKVWEALLATMPITALIRNLGRMSEAGLFTEMGKNEKLVCEKLRNQEILQKARIHPMNIFSAMKTYQEGHGIRTTWKVNQAIVDALQDAFYSCFNYVEPTGKNIFIGVDVSPSMHGQNIAGTSVTSAEAATVVAMTIARTEKNHYIYAFSGDRGWDASAGFTQLKISAKDSLEDVFRKMEKVHWGHTDCSLPMRYATEQNMDVDAFIVLTDNETNGGKMHPFEALKKYRNKSKKNARLVVGAFTATEFSIADPSDSGMLDIGGLDSSVPQLISDFVKGSI